MIKKADISIKLGEKIRKYRILAKLSQESLANIAGLHRTYIGMIERGEKNLTIVNLEKVANALKIKISEIVEGL